MIAILRERIPTKNKKLLSRLEFPVVDSNPSLAKLLPSLIANEPNRLAFRIALADSNSNANNSPETRGKDGEVVLLLPPSILLGGRTLLLFSLVLFLLTRFSFFAASELLILFSLGTLSIISKISVGLLLLMIKRRLITAETRITTAAATSIAVVIS